jgi:hypothetical protein
LKATIPTKERETITQLIFDTNGLCNANDAFTFEQISSQITSTTSNTQFIDYFNNCFKIDIVLQMFSAQVSSGIWKRMCKGFGYKNNVIENAQF